MFWMYLTLFETLEAFKVLFELPVKFLHAAEIWEARFYSILAAFPSQYLFSLQPLKGMLLLLLFLEGIKERQSVGDDNKYNIIHVPAKS